MFVCWEGSPDPYQSEWKCLASQAEVEILEQGGKAKIVQGRQTAEGV